MLDTPTLAAIPLQDGDSYTASVAIWTKSGRHEPLPQRNVEIRRLQQSKQQRLDRSGSTSEQSSLGQGLIEPGSNSGS